jgi:lipid II:glycine glycyltransferase (peptidoglycan interpeptide bridge formation enzyme)
MTVRFATEAEVQDWDKHVLANPDGGTIFQGKYFAKLKETAGWTPRYIMADDIAITVVEKPIFGFGKVWYAPKGPDVADIEVLEGIIGPLRDFAYKQGVFTMKMEPELPRGLDMARLGLIKTRQIQPNISTVLVDLQPTLPTILKNMPQKGRYAIKRAERDGVTAKMVTVSDENCKIMYNLFKGTAAGQGFGIRPESYYRAFWEGYAEQGVGQLFFAYHDGEVVAGAYVLAYGTKGTYKDGASVRDRKAYGASHLLLWEAIKWLKKRDCTVFDLCGAPPSDQVDNPDHPYHGFGQFKRSFNSEVTDFVGAYELPIRPLKSKIWTKFVEKAVRRLFYKLHHQSYY